MRHQNNIFLKIGRYKIIEDIKRVKTQTNNLVELVMTLTYNLINTIVTNLTTVFYRLGNSCASFCG